MPDPVTTQNTFRSHIETNFTAVPLFWENDLVEPEKRGGDAGFVQVAVNYQQNQQISFGSPGNNKERDYGEIEINVMVPIGTLPGAAIARAQTLRDLFHAGSQWTDIHIMSRRIEAGYRGGPGSRWWCVPVIIEFTSDYLA